MTETNTTEAEEMERPRLGRPPNHGPGSTRANVLELYAQGRTGTSIARELGLTPAAVSYHLKMSRRDGTLVEPPPAPEPVAEEVAE